MLAGPGGPQAATSRLSGRGPLGVLQAAGGPDWHFTVTTSVTVDLPQPECGWLQIT